MPISRSKNKIIGITLGDPSGIGPEVTVKALRQPSVKKLGHFVIIGERKIFQRYSFASDHRLTLIECPPAVHREWKVGVSSQKTAQASLNYLENAIQLLKNNLIHALVTAPVCKESICKIEPSFQGHTEYLASAFQVKNVGMMFVGPRLKTVLVTRHIPLHQVASRITPQLVFDTIQLTHQALTSIFRIKNPLIALCGLNPHAGEGGNIGKEEFTKILPAMKRARQNRIRVAGPLAGDTIFREENFRKYSAIIAMYHDQGLAPIKALYFNKLVNLTIGLPFIRTSPAHGTAFDIAGKNKADPSSMCEAITLAAKLCCL